MGSGCTSCNDNIYFRSRKKASEYNERLCSREGAAEQLGVSSSTLADYELGITKVVPVDKVVLMADLYRCPDLKTRYCKNECPIGKTMPLATEINGIEGVVLRLMQNIDQDKIKRVQDELIHIAADGSISEKEKASMRDIMEFLDKIAYSISELRLISEKAEG